MYDTIIIGGGPAGMTAAIYAAQKKDEYSGSDTEYRRANFVVERG